MLRKTGGDFLLLAAVLREKNVIPASEPLRGRPPPIPTHYLCDRCNDRFGFPFDFGVS
jgi:hypothetical protein